MKHTINSCLTYGAAQGDRLDAELLLAFVIRKNREYIFAHGDEPISLFKRIRFTQLINKRSRGIPLAYLTGHKSFFGLNFLVNKHTLVPRPDTEIMVELVVEKIKNEELRMKNTILVDVGTGSGCIPIAIQKTMGEWGNGTIKTFATDISQGALRVARKNAKHHKTDITFLHGNLLEPLHKYLTTDNGTMSQWSTIILTANLPYLTQEQFESEPSIQHEPKSALVAANNGLALYEELIEQIQKLLTKNPKISIDCFFEIDPAQGGAITKIIQTFFPNAAVEIKKDLAGQDRVVYFHIVPVQQ